MFPVPAFPFVADPDAGQDQTSNPAVHSDADPEPAFETKAVPGGSGSATMHRTQLFHLEGGSWNFVW